MKIRERERERGGKFKKEKQVLGTKEEMKEKRKREKAEPARVPNNGRVSLKPTDRQTRPARQGQEAGRSTQVRDKCGHAERVFSVFFNAFLIELRSLAGSRCVSRPLKWPNPPEGIFYSGSKVSCLSSWEFPGRSPRAPARAIEDEPFLQSDTTFPSLPLHHIAGPRSLVSQSLIYERNDNFVRVTSIIIM